MIKAGESNLKYLTKVPLGAGQDVGRSCILVTIGSVKNFFF
jgi:hypothetical protein